MRTVLQLIDYADRLTLEAVREPDISLEIAGREVAQGPDNLVCRAADLLRRSLSLSAGARMFLEKRIPVGAGLGGGSSDAALALLGLNQLWRCGLSRRDLSRLAAQLGSDVPFFFVGRDGFRLGTGGTDGPDRLRPE